ncbi:MAG: hypothetical protein PHT18_10395 [Proteiniphilum sp.]|nr:hypothetical protein [Proteiniphilum sp.]
MNNVRLTNLIFSCLFCLLINACSNSKESASRATTWSVDEKGWVVTKNAKNKQERFFAIGTWHVPGYTFTQDSDADSLTYMQNETLFKKKTAPFNMLFITPGYEKKYMSDKIHILNPFSPMLHGYLDHVKKLPVGDDKDYYRCQYMKGEVDNPAFIQYLDSQIVALLEKKINDKHIFSHIDEIALGGVSRWAVPPSVGALITQRLKKYEPEALVFVDLLGHARGSSYLFEKRYLKNHQTMPQDPPYNLLSEEARKSKIPLLGFYQAFDGTPVYQFKDGEYSYNDCNPDSLITIWKENIDIIAKDYKGCGDVFGLNAFFNFYQQPVLAGITVDALRNGLGSQVPIWLYFDGNGYAKPSNVIPADYLKNVKCQIYTAIIHGATGVLFWNDWSKTPEVFDQLIPIMKELNGNLEIIKCNTLETMTDNDKNQHVVIKGEKRGKKYILATNTSTTDSITLTIPGGNRMVLSPLEVYLSELQ